MSLIAAMRCRGHILIASDSYAADPLGAYEASKLQRLCDVNVMWGGNGDVRIIKDLRAWIESLQAFDRLDTRQLTPGSTDRGWWTDNFADRLSMLNGNNLARIRQSRAPETPLNVTSEVLLAGYINEQQPVILNFPRHSAPIHATEHGWSAAGTAAERFAGALSALQPKPHSPQTPMPDTALLMMQAMEAAMRGAAATAPPVQVWACSPSRIELLLGFEDGSGPLADRMKESLSLSGKL
ncbi:MAG: hypothetical protein EXR51_01385 [Dehalococcoidia bacterium]|nr:hypothetical protein [Dehalococcoidia bacterium]